MTTTMLPPDDPLTSVLGHAPRVWHTLAPAVNAGAGMWGLDARPLCWTMRRRAAVLVCLEGTGGESGSVGRRQAFAPGAVLAIATGTPFELVPSGPVTMLGLSFDESLLRACPVPWLAREPGHYELRTAQSDDAPTALALARTLVAELSSDDSRRGSCRAALIVGLIEAVACDPRLTQRCASGSVFVEGGIARAIRHIDEHLGSDLTLMSIAERAGVSPYHLSRSFRAAMNEHIAQYVRRRRVERACELLAQTRKSLAEVAFECGYSSQSAMNATFRKVFDETPLQFRRRCWSGTRSREALAS